MITWRRLLVDVFLGAFVGVLLMALAFLVAVAPESAFGAGGRAMLENLVRFPLAGAVGVTAALAVLRRGFMPMPTRLGRRATLAGVAAMALYVAGALTLGVARTSWEPAIMAELGASSALALTFPWLPRRRRRVPADAAWLASGASLHIADDAASPTARKVTPIDLFPRASAREAENVVESRDSHDPPSA